MNKEHLIREIQKLESITAQAQKDLDQLKLAFHKMEIDEQTKHFKTIRDEPFKSMKSWNEGNLTEFHDRMDYLSNIGCAYGIKNSIYSAYDHDLDEIAYDGDCLLVHESFDGEEYTETHTNPTWLDVWVFADKAINIDNDSCHIFFEGLCKGKFENSLCIIMGS